jgi:hypothetical protein
MVLLCIVLAFPVTAGAQAESPSAPTLEQGTRTLLLASPRFEVSDLGSAYPVDLDGLRSTPFVDGPVATSADSTARTWFRVRTDDFRLNVAGTATGMLTERVPVGTRQAAALTIYKIDRVARLEGADPLPKPTGDPDEALLLSALHIGWAMHIVLVGTRATFTRAVADALRQRIDDGRSIEPLLRRHDLSAVVSSRGLGFGYQTPRPTRIPLTWDELEAQYDLGAPEPVLAEYVLLRDVRPMPISWN